MGSCLGTTSSAPPPKTPNSAAPSHHDGGSKSPPPVCEETVKEVLSESPAIPKHRLLPIPRFHESARMLHQNGGGAKKNPAAAEPSGSDDFEIHRESTFSTENDGGMRRPRRDGRLFSGEVKREKPAGGSPARRSDTSPGWVKPGPGYGYGRNTGGGERSGRRSRSPVTRSDSGSSKTPRKMGNYPDRMEYGSGDRIRKGKEEEREPPTNIELLESSLVSLECFIFL